MTTSEPLAIIGLGCLFPKAEGVGAYWRNVKAGVDCITDVPADTHWDPADHFDPDPKAPDMTYARRGGFLSAVDFNPLEFGIPPHDLEATDTSQLLGLVAAKMALADAGVTFAPAPGGRPPVPRDRVSVILGVTGALPLVVPLGARLDHPKWKRAMREAGVPDAVAEDAAARIADGYVPWKENSFPGLLGNVVAGRIANKLDLHGTNCVVDAACGSSLGAVHLAALELQTGRADVAVTGGVDTFNDVFMFACFSKTPAFSPTGDARPFDAAGDGTLIGEGLGILVLKRLADAELAGDRVYAVLKGLGSSSDGKGNAIYAPSAAGQERALRAAYRHANVNPASVELVEAHGTGTKVGDAVEATALSNVYAPHADPPGRPPRPWCAIGSVKSQIGHTKAAAGSASLIKTALALFHKVLPPTLKVTRPVAPLAAGSPFYLNPQARPWVARREHPRRAGVSAFGFGGTNFHAVLEEHRPEKAAPDWDGSVEILAVSAADPNALAAALPAAADWASFARAAEASRRSFQTGATCRLLVVGIRGATDLGALLDAVRRELASNPRTPAWSIPDVAYYGCGPAPGRLGLLVPGPGSHAVGMLRDLACLFPEVLDALAAANDPGHGGPRLSDLIYPPHGFEPGDSARQAAELAAPGAAAAAVAALVSGVWRVLHERFGIEAAAFAGCSDAFDQAGRNAHGGDHLEDAPTDEELLALLRSGVRTFVEVGPGTVLTRRVRALAAADAARDVAAVALDESAGRRSGILDLAIALSHLAARGHPVRFYEWEKDGLCRPGPVENISRTVRVCGANIVKPRPKREPAALIATVAPVAPAAPVASIARPQLAAASPQDSCEVGTDTAMERMRLTLAALELVQERTSQAHGAFLEGQHQAHRTLYELVTRTPPIAGAR